MNLRVSNRQQLNEWMCERRKKGHDLVAIKGPAPEGATYSNGNLITRPINWGWRDCTTGELFAIEREPGGES